MPGQAPVRGHHQSSAGADNLVPMPDQRFPNASPIGGVASRVLAWALPALLALTAASPALRRQQPEPRSMPGRFEVDGFDFRPDGAWRRGTERVRIARRNLLRAGDLTTLNRAAARRGLPRDGLTVEGTYVVPVVPIAFRNVAAPFPASQYQSV